MWWGRQEGKEARKSFSPTFQSSSWFACHSAVRLLLGLVCVLGFTHQLSKILGGSPKIQSPEVYSTFHPPQLTPEEIVSRINSLERAYRKSTAWQPDKARVAVQEILRLGNCGASKHGKPYRSLICTIVRNDIHLREFLVRNLLQGFCHIVVYDNNQIGAGMDHSIRLLLEPFVAEGVVTHVPFMQNMTQFLHNDQKDQHAFECVERYGSQADWVTVMDTDEYFHVSKPAAQPVKTQPADRTDSTSRSIVSSTQSDSSSSSSSSSSMQSVGTLDSFLHDVESSELDICGLAFMWQMMYGEHRILRSKGLLLDTYQRLCFSGTNYKTLFKPDRATPDPPHSVICKHGHEKLPLVDSDEVQTVLPQYSLKLYHYYSRSIEEYITKSEQSMPPYIRYMADSYDSQRCDMDSVAFDQQYTDFVHELLHYLQSAQAGLPSGGIMLSATHEWQPMGRPDYALYIFLKLRVQQRQEWDESAYLLRNPAAAKLVAQHKFVDGLHHFLVKGFSQGLTSCWKQEGSGERVCL